jgi:hypothetical protein
MPKISLVVCLYEERNLLERLLQHAEGCYDDLVVVHDGPEEAVPAEDRRAGGGEQPNQKSAINQPPFPRYEEGWKSPEQLSLKEPDAPPFEIARDYAELPKDAAVPSGYRLKAGIPQPGSIHELVVRHGGRFYEGPRCFQQEPHWPFAWWAAKHDWILRLDADEFPSEKLKVWLKEFRSAEEPEGSISGFTCIWPLWNGQRPTTKNWPNGRIFLFHRMRVRMVGLVEQSPVGDLPFVATQLTLCHQPKRKSYGIRNIIFRSQAYKWRTVVAKSLQEPPFHLPRWRWTGKDWPVGWSKILEAPFFEGFYRLLKFPLEQAKKQMRAGERLSISECLNPALHHFLICMQVWKNQNYPLPLKQIPRAVRKVILHPIFRLIGKR